MGAREEKPMTEERRQSEGDRRELARQHRGEVVADSASAVEPRRMPIMVSVRLEADLVAELRNIAADRGATMSEVLRDSVRLFIHATRAATRAVALNWNVIPVEGHTAIGIGRFSSSGWDLLERAVIS